MSFSQRSGWLALGIICLVALGAMLILARQDAPIMDELAHIPSGYSYVRYLDYRLNPEHPPLLKAAAALPLLALHLNFPTASQAWTSEINSQWSLGSQFLYESGNDPELVVFWSRIVPILLTLLLIGLTYLWAAELLGPLWGLVPAALLGLSPNVLAHGHYVTTDVAAAFGVVLGTYFFLKFLHNPSRTHILYAGLAFGVAQLMKFSAVLIVPYFLFLIFIFYLVNLARDWSVTEAAARWGRFGIRAWHYLRATFMIFLIGYALVVYPVYALLTFNYPQAKQVSDTDFILTSFAGGPPAPGHFCAPLRCVAQLDIAMTKNAVTRPIAQYLLGVLMVMQRSSGGNTAYFLGEVSAAGSRLYFPTVYRLKEPLATLLFILGALGLGLTAFGRMLRDRTRVLGAKVVSYLSDNFTQFAILTFIVLYWTYSSLSPLNIGFRHLFPTLPLIYMLGASVWQKSRLLSLWSKQVVMVFFVLWLAVEAFSAFPYYLSYFNELGGGVMGGYHYATDSNYDWGQDLFRLRSFLDAHPEINAIAVDYFGGGNPVAALGGRAVAWQSSKGDPTAAGIRWLAVSVNALQSDTQPLAPGQQRSPADEYRWLTALRPPSRGIGNVPEPDYRVGTSIFVYQF